MKKVVLLVALIFSLVFAVISYLVTFTFGCEKSYCDTYHYFGFLFILPIAVFNGGIIGAVAAFIALKIPELAHESGFRHPHMLATISVFLWLLITFLIAGFIALRIF